MKSKYLIDVLALLKLGESYTAKTAQEYVRAAGLRGQLQRQRGIVLKCEPNGTHWIDFRRVK